MRTRLVPALLAALAAACTVDNSALKPKTEAECAAELGPDSKVCGNRCARKDDPALGCGDPGCLPCPAGAGQEATCDGGLHCATRAVCPAGQRYCDGPTDTACEHLLSDASHCGACGHVCGGACTSGFCDPTVAQTSGSGAVAIAGFDAQVAYLANDYGADPTLSALYVDGAFLTTVPGPNEHLLGDTWGAVVWSDAPGRPITSTAYWNPDPTKVELMVPASRVRSMTLDMFYAYFVEVGSSTQYEDATTLLAVDRDGGRLYHYAVPGGSSLLSVAAMDPAYDWSVAVATEAGALRWVDYVFEHDGVFGTGVEAAQRLVIYIDLAPPDPAYVAFWLGASGSLYSKRLPAGPVVRHTTAARPPTGALELRADAEGVYWSDETNGYVAEWRPVQRDVVVLYLDAANPPIGVASTVASPGRVYWLLADGAILSAAK